LKPVVLDEGQLERMELPIPFQSLDRRYPSTFLHRRQRHARHDTASVDMHGAGATLASIATLLCARQSQFLTQRIKQRHARFDHYRASFAIHHKVHCHALGTSTIGS
jgi:hypothetical protein